MILEHSSRPAQQETDNDDGNKCACDRAGDNPCVKLQNDDEDKHRDDCDSAAPKDAECKNAGNCGYNNAEHDRNCGLKRRMLKPLLRGIIMMKETALSRCVVEHILKPGEQSGDQSYDTITDRSVASVWHAFVGIIIE